MENSIKFILSALLVVVFYSYDLKAQNSSLNELYMIWEDDIGWSAGGSPGPLLSGENVLIRGSVDRNGNITLQRNGLFGADSKLVIDEGDTLVIDGNLNIGSTSEMEVRENAFLIIFGDLEGADFLFFSGSDVDNSGTVVVTGDADFSDYGNNDNNGDFYVFGETTGDLDGNNILDEDDMPLDLNDFIDNGAPLPIELKSFTVDNHNNIVKLDWITAKEENFSHFELERAIYSNGFEVIGILEGKGNSLSDISYSFIDDSAPVGLLKYRLKAVDIDESFEYSDVIEIKNSFKNNIAIYPNPTTSLSQLRLVFPEDFKEKITNIKLYNMKGESLLEAHNIDLKDEVIFDQDVKSGLYLLRIQHNGIEENLRLLIK